MKKNLFIIALMTFVTSSLIAQISNNDDYVNLYQVNESYPGFISYTYRGLHPVGHAQFKMYNYGGTPNAKTVLGPNEILGSYVFNGYNGSQNVISAVIRARTITASNDPRLDFVLARPTGGRIMRMTMIGETGYVGIGVSDPTEKLDIAGNIRMRTGAAEGHTIVSDAEGRMEWINPVWSGVYNGTIYNEAGYVRIGIGPNFQPNLQNQYAADEFYPSLMVNNSTSDVEVDESGLYNKVIGIMGLCTGGNNYDGSYGSWSYASNAGGATAVGSYAKATGAYNNNIGVEAMADGITANKCYGIKATANGLNTNYGIRAAAFGGTTNWAGYFYGNTKVEHGHLEIENDQTNDTNTNYGVDASALGTEGVRIGVNGYADCSTGLTAYGVRGEAVGEAFSNYGVYGTATGSGGANYFNYAGYFSGNVTVTGTFYEPSDAKLKKNVEEYEDALEIINELDVKTYEYKTDKFTQMNLDNDKKIGMIAQEMEKVLPHLVDNQLHPQKTKKDEDGKEVIVSEAVEYKAVNYIGLIPILTQGVKELSTENEKIKAENLELKDEMAELRNIVGELKQQFSNMENNMQNCCLESNNPSNKEAITAIELSSSTDQAILEQNAPNPFNAQTQIRYYIPSSASKSQMVITDNRGAVLKTINLSETGFGTVFVKAGALAPGTYAYTLFVDGNKVATKQMVLVK